MCYQVTSSLCHFFFLSKKAITEIHLPVFLEYINLGKNTSSEFKHVFSWWLFTYHLYCNLLYCSRVSNFIFTIYKEPNTANTLMYYWTRVYFRKKTISGICSSISWCLFWYQPYYCTLSWDINVGMIIYRTSKSMWHGDKKLLLFFFFEKLKFSSLDPP